MGVVRFKVAASSGQQVVPGADESALVADEVDSLLRIPARLGIVESELLQGSPDQWRVSPVHDLFEFSVVLEFAILQGQLVKVVETITRKMSHDLQQLESVVLQQEIRQREEEYEAENDALPEKAKYLDVGVHLLSIVTIYESFFVNL